MSREDYDFSSGGNPGQTNSQFLTKLNSVIDAVETQNSGAGKDSNTAKFKVAVDTTANTIDMRDSTNSTWHTIGTSEVDNRVVTAVSDYNVSQSDFGKTILVDATSGNVDVNLHAAASAGSGFILHVKRIDDSVNTVTIDPNGAELINGLSNKLLDAKNDSSSIVCDATNWHELSAFSKTNETVGLKRYNLIVNSDLQFWQREVNFNNFSTSKYTADRVKIFNDCGAIVSVLKSTDRPLVSLNNQYFDSVLKFRIETGSTPVSNQRLSIQYRMIGYDFSQLRGYPFVYSCNMKSSVAGDYTILFRSNNDDIYYAHKVTLPASTYQHISFTVPKISGGTFDFGSGCDFVIEIVLDSGNKTAVEDSWTASTGKAVSTQASFASGAANEFFMVGQSIVVGTSPIIYNKADYVTEYQECMRYYDKSYNLDKFPGHSASRANSVQIGAIYDVDTTANIDISKFNFSTEMYNTPTVTIYSPETGVAGSYRGAGVDVVASDVIASTRRVTQLKLTSTGLYGFHYVADGEI